MEAFIEYILKASGILTVFYLTYHLFLKKETFFKVNRHYLLSGLLIAFILPLLTITKYVEASPIAIRNFNGIPVSFAESSLVSSLDWMVILSYVYLLGLVFFYIEIFNSTTFPEIYNKWAQRTKGKRFYICGNFQRSSPIFILPLYILQSCAL